MSATKILNIPVNRVEGDVEIRVQLDQGLVSDAWCSGTMYRGFERILVGRGALDGLVITPRVCGVCTTAHLMAAAGALDMAAHVTSPPDGIRIRNIMLLTEHIQSDMRHVFLMFTADFVNAMYRDCVLFEEACARYEPFKGKTVLDVIRETKRVLEIIAIVGGQWPHSSCMVPGGIVSVPSISDMMQCQLLLKRYRNWYERTILGCTIERWSTLRNATDLQAWLEESKEHWESELGFFIRFARAVGLDKIGRGVGNFLSYGYTSLPGNGPEKLLTPGFVRGKERKPFEQSRIAEEVACSWFVDYEGGKHPFDGETKPYASGMEGTKYSWCKAPRYNGFPAETGPLAEVVMSEDALFDDLLTCNGPSVFVRELARIVRPTKLIPILERLITETRGDGKFYNAPTKITEGKGYGLVHAARGALGHWVEIKDGRIHKYQIITPTSWNASPRDGKKNKGPIEEALMGTEVKDPDNPIELGHIIRSFDPCLVCTVHALSRGKSLGRVTLGTSR